jgi:hypothetical protein
VVECPADELCPRRHVEPGLDASAGGLDGPHAEHEAVGDLTAGVPERDETDDVAVTGGQGVGAAPALEILRGQPHGPHEPRPRRAGGRQHNRCGRRRLAEGRQGAKALALAQVTVEHQHARPQRTKRLLGLIERLGMSDEFEVAAGAQLRGGGAAAAYQHSRAHGGSLSAGRRAPIHVLALAFFVGGQIMLIVAIVPVLSERDEDIMRAVARRFGLASGVAIAVLLATGIALASHFSRWQDETLQAKLAVLLLGGELTALHIATPYSRAVSLALAGSSLTVVWLGVALTH